MKRSAFLLARLMLLWTTLLSIRSPALAHAILIDSVPAPLAHVAASHLAVTLRYNSRIDAARSKLLLTHADKQTRLAQTAGPGGDTLRTEIELTPGDYVIRWQVLATDGHITRGRVPFKVDPVR